MKDFGPLCLYWEGGYRGEGILRDIKALVKQGTYKPYFAKNLMTKYYIDRFLQYLLNVDLGENEEAADDSEVSAP